MDCEKWRKEFQLDDKVRNFDYKEKAQMFEYYPQYYHKTDKVGKTNLPSCMFEAKSKAGWATCLYRATRENRHRGDVQDHHG